MIKTPEIWDKHCSFNIEWIGEKRFIPSLRLDEGIDEEKLNDIYSSCYRFLIELTLSSVGQLGPELEESRKFGINNIYRFDGYSKEQILYAAYSLPISIFKKLIHVGFIEKISNIESTIQVHTKTQEKWNDELKARESEVERLRESLEKYKDGFNFVGLHKGFSELSSEKKKQKSTTLFWLVVFGFLSISPIAIEIIYIINYIEDLVASPQRIIFLSIPTLSLVAVFIYFFRIVLSHYKSLTSQILQIDLRMTLCRFIQSYSDYASEIKTKDKEALSKFENVIFSGIVSDAEKIPSVYDGLDQISSLIQAVKPK